MIGGPSEPDEAEQRRARVTNPQRLAAVRATGLLDSEPEPAFDRIATFAARLLSAPLAFVTLVDDRRSFHKACVGLDADDPRRDGNGLDESFCRYVIGLDDTLLVDDVAHDPRTAGDPCIDAMGIRAWAGAPLRGPGGEAVGTVWVADDAPRQWSGDDRRTLVELAAMGADELAARAAAAAAHRAEALLTAIIERASIGFCLVDDELRFEMVNDALATSNGIPAAAHLGRLAADVLSADSAPIIDAMQSIIDGRQDALEVELVGEVPGNPGRRQAFHAGYFRVDLGDGVRRVAALVSDETERSMSRRRTEIMAELTRHLAIADDLDTVARAIEDLAGDYVGAPTVMVVLSDHARRSFEVITTRPHTPSAATRTIAIGDGPCAEAMRTGELVVVENRSERRRRYPGSERNHLVVGTEASVVVPMRLGSSTPVGLVAFGWTRPITVDELPLRQIDTLVDVITQAVERVRTSSQRRALVSGLQEIVLAAPDRRPGLDVAVRYVPAAGTLGFGGDWYDVVTIDDSERTALVVGDVVGHDAASAVRMTETRAAIRQLLRLDTPPAALFDRAREVSPASTSSALATVVVVVVDPTAHTLHAVSAGHLPPMLVDASGRVRRLPVGLGPFLGIAGSRPDPVVTGYEPGSTLVCYSDGLVESRRDIEEDLEALASALTGSHRRSCEDLATELVERFVDPAALADDVALVVARL